MLIYKLIGRRANDGGWAYERKFAVSEKFQNPAAAHMFVVSYHRSHNIPLAGNITWHNEPRSSAAHTANRYMHWSLIPKEQK